MYFVTSWKLQICRLMWRQPHSTWGMLDETIEWTTYCLTKTNWVDHTGWTCIYNYMFISILHVKKQHDPKTRSSTPFHPSPQTQSLRWASWLRSIPSWRSSRPRRSRGWTWSAPRRRGPADDSPRTNNQLLHVDSFAKIGPLLSMETNLINWSNHVDYIAPLMWIGHPLHTGGLIINQESTLVWKAYQTLFILPPKTWYGINFSTTGNHPHTWESLGEWISCYPRHTEGPGMGTQVCCPMDSHTPSEGFLGSARETVGARRVRR